MLSIVTHHRAEEEPQTATAPWGKEETKIEFLRGKRKRGEAEFGDKLKSSREKRRSA